MPLWTPRGGAKRWKELAECSYDPHIFMRFSGFSQDELQVQDRYLEFSQQDPRASWRRFKAIHCRQVVSDEVLHASEMYRQVLSRSGIEYSMYFHCRTISVRSERHEGA
jgi:hypothetical protein